LDSNIFEDLYKSYLNNFDDQRSWKDLAKEYGFSSGESIRASFKRERRARGLPNKNQIQNNIVIENKPKNTPRIGVMDCETLPILSYNWALFDQNISIGQIVKDMSLLSWSGKYLNESKIYSDILLSSECENRLDQRIVQSAHDFISSCDIIIGHNWSEFDGKIFNTLFLEYGFSPVKYKTIDTLAIAKFNFRFTSRKLEFINNKLGIRNKISTEGFALWARCDRGDQEALNTMLEYNIGDIYATEQLFYKIRPYVNNINVALYNEIEECQCPNCGNLELQHEGYYLTKVSKFESLRCLKCGAVSRRRDNLVSKEKRKNLLQSFN
jgi:hypothetical protein